ncbi:universal stress protein [Streptomyces sp. GXMU-J15]|uniref:Universal stress protein n=1 Tax=Streptomyces fuscus TaxID=3048495 RepID=A0ABT7ITN1_9ACTN|nr:MULTISPECIES: universal stress protein [Streptomyces]MDL2074882.1 universal stress protein [Streptomyces fuscus]SBT93413.1 Nucleotide-binding universal stress protein, UspA family [Streptomyces sp. DI166]
MTRTVVAGLDGSPESRAAAEWAAREAKLLGLPLKIVQVWEPVPEPLAQAPLLGAETHQHWTERIPREAADGLRARHPGLEVTTEQLHGPPAEAIAKAAEGARMLVLGSRGLSGLAGFMVGSVGLSVVAHTTTPVVLVRAGEQATDEHAPDPSGIPSASTPYRPVVLGLDADHPDAAVIEFAFEAAARRETKLRVLHGWNLPPYYVYGLTADAQLHDEIVGQQSAALREALRPWRQKYPDVEVVEESPAGSPGVRLVDAAHEASLVVIGRRIRRRPFGAHIGPVAHAVLHHSTAPVAVVAHD